MTVQVTVKTVAPMPTAVVAAAVTWAEFPTRWGPMLDQVWHFIREAAPEGLYQHGHNIMLYKDEVPNVEVGVQVTRSFAAAGPVVPSALPGGLVATATHAGPVAQLGDTYRAVSQWSKDSRYQLADPHWEIYGDPDPSTGSFTVDIYWSLSAEEPGYLTESGEAVGEDGSVVPVIGGLPAVEGSSWDIGAPTRDRGAGLAEEEGRTAGDAGDQPAS
jgi:effector-binding domain-containing protein